MIVLSPSLVVSLAEEASDNNPLIGWHNLVTIENVTSFSEADGYPVTNLANPITSAGGGWQAEAAGDETIEVAIEEVEPIDYAAIAAHNFGRAGIVVTVEGSTDFGVTWFELVEEQLLADDSPAIFRFEPQSLTNVRLLLAEGSEAAACAVLYVGKLLVLQRRIYVGHTPMPMGRSQKIVNGKSEAGDYLGRIVTSEQRATAVDLKNLTPAWYRSEMDPFIAASKDTPFFFAWRPGDYPLETGFGWMTNDPQPRNSRPNGMMEISFQMTGIV